MHQRVVVKSIDYFHNSHKITNELSRIRYMNGSKFAIIMEKFKISFTGLTSVEFT